MRTLLFTFLLVWLHVSAPAAGAEAAALSPKVLIQTTLGDVAVELYPEQAPATVKNFLGYVESGFYDNTVVHRVVPGFIVQGGGYDAGTYEEKATQRPIKNEAGNGLENERGTLAMARTANPHSAASQFFINLDDNESLDHTDKTLRGWGYCVFGRVTAGMEVVDAIAAVELDQEWPVEDVVIERISVITGDEGPP